MTFRDQVVLITGASSGIGQRLAIDLAARGTIVIGCSRSRERLQETLAAMQRTSPASAVIPCDVGDREQAHAMIQSVLAERGKIDILINNAGIGMRKPFVETSADIIEDIMRTNYFGMVHCTRAVLPSMIARGSGHIVNISSSLGKIGTFNMAAYCASKFAMNGLSESLYHELKPLGIHVSVVCPGAVRTGFNKNIRRHPAEVTFFFGGAPRVGFGGGHSGHREKPLRSCDAALARMGVFVQALDARSFSGRLSSCLSIARDCAKEAASINENTGN